MNERVKSKPLTDLSLAAYLLSIGHREVAPPGFIGRSYVCHFEPSPKLEQDICDYYGGRARVEPITYSGHLTKLREMMWLLKGERKARMATATGVNHE